ncbi:MAG: hypothetical protein AB7O87_09975 [Candidatus Nitrosocosmicus sp.]
MEQQQQFTSTSSYSQPLLSDYYSKKQFMSSPLYRNFINSLKARHTKVVYAHTLYKTYLCRSENQNLTLEDIIKKDPRKIEYELIDIIYEMKEKRNLSYSTIHNFVTIMIHFFEINDVTINRKKLKKFKGEHVAKYEYRSYTHEEISNLLSSMDERGKTTVLLMSSTGMRVGALTEIKLKHLKRWSVSRKDHVYQITVYANSPKSKYKTFCTPEAAKAIDTYLEFRKRHGDRVKQDPETGDWTPGESFLFIKNFDTNQRSLLGNLPLSTIFTLGIGPKTISHAIIKKLEDIGYRNRLVLLEDQASTKSERQSLYSKHKNEIHPCHSLRIFAVTQMQRAKIDKTIREMIVGHATGLDKVYYKPQDEEILQEYLKATDFLTISNENRLQKQVDYYKSRADRLEEMAMRLDNIEKKWASN